MTWRLDLALYPAVRGRPGTSPRRRSWTWEECCEHLTRPLRIADRAQRPAWAPHALAEGGRRRAADVLHVGALVLDYDDREPPWARLHGWRHLWHTTWSHSEERPGYRVVLPMAAPCPAERWRATWRALAPEGADPAPSSPASCYYLACARPGYAWGVMDGETMDPRPWPSPPRPRRRVLPRHLPEPRRREWDPDYRLEVGAALGRVVGDVIRDAVCPQCGRPSVWWPIHPTTHPRAMCDHRQSCGWIGRLEDLT